MGACEANPALRNPDTLARAFIGPKLRFLATAPGVRALTRRVYDRLLPGLYLAHLARTKHIDALVASALWRGVAQVVVLGAGLDSRAYRPPGACVAGVTWYEVDHPDTQAWKLAAVHRTLGEPPEHVRFVSVDLSRQPLVEPLRAAGLDPHAKTLVIWEGVTMYLSEQDVAATLVQLATVRCEVVFDYVYREAYEDPARHCAAQRHFRYVRSLGEPCRFGLAPTGVDAFAAHCGFRVLSNADAEELERRHLGQPSLRSSAMASFLGIAHVESESSPSC